MSLGQEEHEGVSPSAGREDAEGTPPASVGEYTWSDFFDEFDDEASRVSPDPSGDESAIRIGWETDLNLDDLVGCPPDEIQEIVDEARERARTLDFVTYDTLDPAETPVRQGDWSWHHFVREFVDPEWDEVRLPGDFDPSDYLGYPEETLGENLAGGTEAADILSDIVERRTVNVNPEIDESAFFTSVDGSTTITNRYDLEKAVPMEKKLHFRELERYWVNKPYAFVSIFRSEKENETKYYLVEPYQTEIEANLFEFLTEKLRTSIKYTDDLVIDGTEEDRRLVLERETRTLLDRYDIHDAPPSLLEDEPSRIDRLIERVQGMLGEEKPEESELRGISARPEPAILEEDAATLSEYQVEKLMYRLRRNFLGYERIDGVKHDINVEDISCDGYNSPVFVYHSSYEQIISNIYHGKERLDDFVIKLAQRSGKGISKRQPQVDATLPDGSRAQLTLGREVSDHGTNYTIRQFNDVPFTPIDLINWRTFSLEEMAFLWLCIENHKSLIFAGGTASGKTTSLNAVSLFIPSNSKIVSIEDTREVELPQRNWIASVTRPSFSDDEKGDVDEFDLLEAALRQRPEYIVMGEIRGDEGRTLFQVMSTGHTTYTTFHADSVGEVLKRFTTAPINVSKTMFTALDLVSIQTSTRVRGQKVRRNKSLTEINHYDTENDEINVQDIYQWQAETDEFLRIGQSNTLDEILFDRGWTRDRLDDELFKREAILAYLIQNGLKEYREVAATLQAFITDPDTILSLIANGRLEESLQDLREMESVLIDVDPEKEALVPRPDPDGEMQELTRSILDRAEEELFPEYEDETPEHIGDILAETQPAADVVAEPGVGAELSETIPAEDGEPAEEADVVTATAVDADGTTDVSDDADGHEASAADGEPVSPEALFEDSNDEDQREEGGDDT